MRYNVPTNEPDHESDAMLLDYFDEVFIDVRDAIVAGEKLLCMGSICAYTDLLTFPAGLKDYVDRTNWHEHLTLTPYPRLLHVLESRYHRYETEKGMQFAVIARDAKTATYPSHQERLARYLFRWKLIVLNRVIQ